MTKRGKEKVEKNERKKKLIDIQFYMLKLCMPESLLCSCFILGIYNARLSSVLAILN